MQPKPDIPTGSRYWNISRALLAASLQLVLTGCSSGGAPSFTLFGAFFPGWMFCGLAGIIGAVAARAVFVGSGLSNALPYQLFVCTAIGVIVAVLVWFVWFGR
jgi:YtcA family